MRTKLPQYIRKVAGSKMKYPFLENCDTIKFMRNSRVMIFLSGFGGKDDKQSSLSRKIIDKFPDSSRSLQYSSGVREPLDKAIEDKVRTIVIDNASDDVECMQQYYTVAHEEHYIELALKAGSKGTFRAIEPTFYGWFLNFDASHEVRKKGQSVLRDSFAEKQFADDFRKQLPKNPPKDLQDYFSTKELDVGATMLHCTSMHDKMDGFEEYNERVAPYIGRVFQIEVLGFLITPRTFGARLKLDEHAEKLWENGDDDKPDGWEPSRFSPTNGSASRAHLTLEIGPGVEAVQTGVDLEELVELEVKAQRECRHIQTYNIPNATLRDYGKGQAMVYLNEPMPFSFLFSGYNLKK